MAWLVGVARHKLVDHWRRIDLERRKLGVIGCDAEPAEDPWDAQLDVAAAHAALSRLSAHHRAALTLRYLDGLPVAEVAGELGRSLHATETLLVRARAAFRRVYEEGQGHDAWLAKTRPPITALLADLVPVRSVAYISDVVNACSRLVRSGRRSPNTVC